MKTILNNTRITFLLFASICATTAYGQIGEWIADQIKQEIESQISSVTNYNSNNLGSFGSYIWESVVSAKCESDLQDKAKQLKDVEIDQSYLLNLSKKYPAHNKYWTNYSEIRPHLYSRANSYFHKTNKIPFKEIANNTIDKKAASYIDSISSVSSIETIESVLSHQVLDSLKLFSHKIEVKDSLLADIRENISVALFLNNHPEAVRVYYNSLNVTELRKQIQHLFYWAVNADCHKDKLSKKQQLINPRHLVFVSKEDGLVEILDGEKVLATLKNNNLYVEDINIMNLIGRPKTVYIFGNNQWITDAYGRVVSTKQECRIALKKKCKQKNDIKIKNLKKNFAVGDAKEPWFYNLPEFGAPEVILNTFFYEKSKTNKAAINNGKKAIKNQIKRNGTHIHIANATYNN